MADNSTIRIEDIGLNATESPSDESFNLRYVRDNAERVAITRVLGRANGNLSKAADMLGVSRPTLYDMMNRFGFKS